MENSLFFLVYGKRPQYHDKWKRALTILQMEDHASFKLIEWNKKSIVGKWKTCQFFDKLNHLHVFAKRSQPQFSG